MSTPRPTVIYPEPPQEARTVPRRIRRDWALVWFVVHFSHVFALLEGLCHAITWHLPILGYGRPSILAAIELAYLVAAMPMGARLLMEAQASRSQWVWLVSDVGPWETIGFTVGLALVAPPLACLRLAWAACQGRRP